MIGIYEIINKVNNKKYIGKAKNIEIRFLSHKKELKGNFHKNKHLNAAWNKYREHNFEFQIIELCKEEELNDREKHWIKFYKTYDSKLGYNKTMGGDGGAVHSSCLENVRIANKGNKYRLGKKHTLKTKALLSKKASVQFTNQWKDKKYREKMSTQTKQLWESDKYREKQAVALRSISNEKVVEIYQDCLIEKSNKKLSIKHGVSPTMICNIRYRKSWYGEVICEAGC